MWTYTTDSMDFVTVSTGLILPYWMGLPIRYIHQWSKSKEEASMLIDKRQLSWLLIGLEIEQKHAHHKIVAVI